MGRRISLKREAIKWFITGFVAGAGLAVFHEILAQEQPAPLGASYLGICHKEWPCSKSLKVFDGLEVKRVGWLHMTFGAPQCPCALRFLELEGRKEIRVHLTNGTCFKERGRVCGAQEPFRGLTIKRATRALEGNNPQLIRRLKSSWVQLKPMLERAKAEGVKVFLSPCLECPLSKKARGKMLSLAREMFPGTTLVDSVVSQRCLPGSVCEKHGAAPKVKSPCIIDTDGVDFRDIDLSRFTSKARQCEIGFLWSEGMNLLPKEGKEFIDPRKRKRKDAPSSFEFEALGYALTLP